LNERISQHERNAKRERRQKLQVFGGKKGKEGKEEGSRLMLLGEGGEMKGAGLIALDRDTIIRMCGRVGG